MNIDTGLGVVIIAVLLFYLRLIILQRQRAKQARGAVETGTGKKRKGKPSPPPNYSIVSQNRRDWVVAGMGVFLILMGAVFYLNWLPWPLANEYWWIPTALGIVGFSWLFRM